MRHIFLPVTSYNATQYMRHEKIIVMLNDLFNIMSLRNVSIVLCSNKINNRSM